MTRILLSVIAGIDRCTEIIGRTAALSSVLMVLVTSYIVITRYVFNEGSIAVQESVIYFNALLFMLTAGYTLKHNGHVRVDIFYSRASEKYRAWADLLGSLLLLMPVNIFIFTYSWNYVMNSWAIQEQSGEPGGLPYVYLLKTLILVLCALLLFQGLAEILRNLVKLYTGQADAAIGPKGRGTQAEEGAPL